MKATMRVSDNTSNGANLRAGHRAGGRHAGGRLVSLLEGGYSLSALRACSVAHLQGLLEAR